MAWFADLTPCNYFGDGLTQHLLAVGWLDRSEPFATGPLNPEIYSKLVELLKDPWQPVASGGYHNCGLCLYDGPAGTRNLFVPTHDAVFACPELIVHYMNAHAYRPPDRFCEAVLECPQMRSMPYLKALSVASKALVRAATA